MQNITSAKYMIFNVTGGIGNVLTGWTNIAGEVFAKEFLIIVLGIKLKQDILELYLLLLLIYILLKH